jgi:thioredoxin
MTSSRRLLLLTGLAMAIISTRGFAAERHTYTEAAFVTAQQEDRSIVVHITAPWCGECQLQKPIVARLTDDPKFKELTIFDVDFDTQKDALRHLNVRTQSTLIAFKGKSEVTRLVGDTQPAVIEALMKKAL